MSNINNKAIWQKLVFKIYHFTNLFNLYVPVRIESCTQKNVIFCIKVFSLKVVLATLFEGIWLHNNAHVYGWVYTASDSMWCVILITALGYTALQSFCFYVCLTSLWWSPSHRFWHEYCCHGIDLPLFVVLLSDWLRQNQLLLETDCMLCHET